MAAASTNGATDPTPSPAAALVGEPRGAPGGPVAALLGGVGAGGGTSPLLGAPASGGDWLGDGMGEMSLGWRMGAGDMAPGGVGLATGATGAAGPGDSTGANPLLMGALSLGGLGDGMGERSLGWRMGPPVPVAGALLLAVDWSSARRGRLSSAWVDALAALALATLTAAPSSNNRAAIVYIWARFILYCVLARVREDLQRPGSGDVGW
jgi:hypothetical protein